MTTRIKFDLNTIKSISLFENITHSSVKDCFEQQDRLVFIVNPGEIGKAIGKEGANIRRISALLKKKIKIIEFSPELIEFVKNTIMPLKAEDITESEGIVTITPPDTETRGMLIGRGAATLRGFEEAVKRYFDIKEIKVV